MSRACILPLICWPIALNPTGFCFVLFFNIHELNISEESFKICIDFLTKHAFDLCL